MNSLYLLGIIEIIVGVVVNIFIGRIAKTLFRKDGTLPRIPLRILGVFLVINGISKFTN